MKEKTKFILGGVWVVILVLISVGLLSLFQDERYYGIVALVWAFAFLSGLLLSSWWSWAIELKKQAKD